MSKEQNNQKENKALHIGVVVRSFMEELGNGTEALGTSIQKSGLLPHLIFVWCLVWGFIGFLYTLARMFG